MTVTAPVGAAAAPIAMVAVLVVAPVAVTETEDPPLIATAAAAWVVEATVSAAAAVPVMVAAPKPVEVSLVIPVQVDASTVTEPAEFKVTISMFFTVALAGGAMGSVSFSVKESPVPAPPSA